MTLSTEPGLAGLFALSGHGGKVRLLADAILAPAMSLRAILLARHPRPEDAPRLAEMTGRRHEFRGMDKI